MKRSRPSVNCQTLNIKFLNWDLLAFFLRNVFNILFVVDHLPLLVPSARIGPGLSLSGE